MEDLLSKWCLEYSFSQNTFFSAPLEFILKMNHESLLKGEQHDFVLIGVYETKKKLELAAEVWQKKMKSKIIFTDLEGRLKVKSNDS